MNFIRYLVIVWLVLSMSVFGVSVANAEDKGGPTRLPLFAQEILDRDGKPVQESPSVTQFLEFFRREANIEFRLQRLPWRRAQYMATEGHGIIWDISKTKERLRKFRYSEPVMHANIWAIAYGEPRLRLDTLQDLRGKIVSVERGVSHGMNFDESRQSLFRVDEDTASAASRFRKLIAKRSDVLLWGLVQFDRPEALSEYINRVYVPSFRDSELIGKTFYVSSRPLFIDTIHFATKKGVFEEEMQRLDGAIRRGLASGELSRILRQM